MLGPKGESYHPCVRRTVESPRCGSSRSALRVEELGVINDVIHPLWLRFSEAFAIEGALERTVRSATSVSPHGCRPPPSRSPVESQCKAVRVTRRPLGLRPMRMRSSRQEGAGS